MLANTRRKAPKTFGLGPVRVISERIEKKFRRLNRPLFHTLRIASSNHPMKSVPKAQRTRLIPCTWGVRRDDYHWDSPSANGNKRDMSAFRRAAAGMAAVLLLHPLPAWGDLLPGTMNDIVGNPSTLYLADYWVLTLHHLVWSKKLPYLVNTRWVLGDSIHDETFYFISELPVDLIEASQDALILFQETATTALLEEKGLSNEPDKLIYPDSVEPPLYRNDDDRHAVPFQYELGKQTATPLPEKAELADNERIELDDRTFTVRFNNRSCRFVGRNKQLFALLERISRRPGCRVSFDGLRSKDDVWDGSPVEDSTIRSAVARLRKTLKEHGLTDLAARISTGTYQGSGYAMLRAEAKAIR